MNIRKIAGFCLGMFAGTLVLAQTPTKALTPDTERDPIVHTESLLWEITGEDLAGPSYLFGTIHIMPRDSFFLPEGVEESLNQSDRLVLEMVLDMAAISQSAMGIMMSPQRNLSHLLEEEDYHYLQSVIRDSLRTPIPFFHLIKPIFLAQQLSASYCLEGIPESYELFFTEKFKELKKPVSGLETAAEQLAFFNNVPEEKQVEELMETARSLGSICQMYDQMFHLYRKQDLQALMRLIHEDQSLEDIKDDILDGRNRNWVSTLETLMQEDKLFIAVGAAHLPGHSGVIQLLKERGYEVRPVISQGP